MSFSTDLGMIPHQTFIWKINEVLILQKTKSVHCRLQYNHLTT